MAIIQVQKTDTFEIFRVKTNFIGSYLGDLTLLTTTSNSSIVDSINEVKNTTVSSDNFTSIIGDKNNLTTTDKTNLVLAINEINAVAGGDLNDLTTTNKDSLIDAVNELDSDIGNLTTLSTSSKTSTVSAINEVVANLSTADSKVKPIAEGGTGATTNTNARTNLGLGTIATQNSNNVSITGGSVATSTLTGVIDKARIASGTANQVAGINAANNALEYKTITAGANVTVTHGVNSITIAANPNNTPTADTLTTTRNIAMTGDVSWSVNFNGSANVSSGGTLSNTGVSAGTYQSVTVDSKGRVTAASSLTALMIPALDWSKITTGKPTTLSGYGIVENNYTLTHCNITSVSLTTSATTANQVITSLVAASFRSMKITIQVTSGTDYQISELLLIHNGTIVQVTEYANLYTSVALASFDADISSGNIRLLTTPVNAVTVYKANITAINT